ncbi:SDR family oxidoreductase [Edaphobacter albus]|uniref:SDR family oxidoreductase n=1 Tax=Edaphobacter sp. 4G125 TaxID=2763071 RepID=UPI001646C3CC|nr:SDR family oxidoreductase [Edaphobacter sp. 4G125]QNI37127.1 SDR family oxidoreductase [Edaphobacter sp. 4G125]
MANYLITGGAGFIGSHLVHALVARGDQVRVLDNFETGLKKNLEPVWDRIEVRAVDLADADAVQSACEGIDYVMHEGALPSVPRSVKEPRPSHRTNIEGTFNVLEGARLAGVKRVIYAASSSAYGNQPGFPRVETMAPQPLSPYAVQKLTGELYMQAYWRVYGLETVCLRYFNIFGARQVPDSPYSGVMARFILMMMRGERPTVFGDGEQGRDFTHVENVVQANLLAVDAPATLAAGRVFNIACGQRHTLNETYALLATLLDFKHPPIYGPEREGDVRDSLADISAASAALGYVPRIDFEEGLRRTVAWYRDEFAG